MRRLFFDNLDSFERFEDLLCAVLNTRAASSGVSGEGWSSALSLARRYGGKGEAQQGIDLIGLLENGSKVVFQCKYHTEEANRPKVGKTQAEDAVAKAQEEYSEADIYVLVTNTAFTAGAQKSLDDAGWHRWGGEQIFDLIRTLPSEQQYWLIKDHLSEEMADEMFPTGFDLLVCPSRYRSSFKGSFLEHRYQCVGRDEEIAQLKSALTTTKPRAVILSGDGGTGKSRIFCEILEQLAEYDEERVLILNPQAERATDVARRLRLIGQERVIIGMDECQFETHFREDVAKALKMTCADGRLFLVMRPEAVPERASVLRRMGWDVDVPLKQGLSRLNLEQMVLLAEEVVGQSQNQEIVNLAHLSDGLPLVVITGGGVMKKHGVDAFRATQSEAFRKEVFQHLEDDVLASVGSLRRKTFQRAFRLMAMVSPFSDDERPEMERILGYSDGYQLDEISDLLTQAGMLRGSGKSIRVIPDIFAKHLREMAIRDLSFDRVLRALISSSIYDDHREQIGAGMVIANWKSGCEDPRIIGLVEGFLKQESVLFESADDGQRKKILNAREGWAHLEPETTLKICRSVLSGGERPKANEVYEPSQDIIEFQHRQARAAALDLVSQVARYSDVFQEPALEILWEYRLESKQTNSRQHTPFGKVFALERQRNIDSVLSAIKWLTMKFEASSDFEWITKYSPEIFEILSGTFEIFFETNYSIGNTFSMGSGAWSIERTQEIRDASFEFCEKLLEASEIGAANVAALLTQAADDARPPFGPLKNDAWLDALIPSRMKGLELLVGILERYDDPALTFLIRKKLKFLRKEFEGNKDEVEALADRSYLEIEVHPEVALFLVLNSEYWDEQTRQERKDSDNQRWEKLRAIGVQFLIGSNSDESISASCEKIALRSEQLGLRPSFWDIFKEISTQRPEFIEPLVIHILGNPDCVFASSYNQLSSYLSDHDDFLSRAIWSGEKRHLENALHAFSWNVDLDEFPKSKAALEELVRQAEEGLVQLLLKHVVNPLKRDNKLGKMIADHLRWGQFSADQLLYLDGLLCSEGSSEILSPDIAAFALKRAQELGVFPEEITNIFMSVMEDDERLAFQFCEASVQLGKKKKLKSWEVLPQLLEGEIGFSSVGEPERTGEKAQRLLDDYLQDSEDSLTKQWFRMGYLNGGGPGQSVLLSKIKAATDKGEFDLLVELASSGSAQLCLYVPEFPKAILETCAGHFSSDLGELKKRLIGSIWLRSQGFTNGVPENRSILETAEKNSARFADDPILSEFYSALVSREYAAEKQSKEAYERRNREVFDF